MFFANSMKTMLAAIAVAAAACGGSDGRREQQPIQDRMRTQPQELTVTGCVQSGTLETAFVLQNAHAQPPAPDASGQSQTAHPSALITAGSTVQLVASDGELRQHVGKQVTVRGTIADTGENTIGTAGTEGTQVPSGDRSMAADRSKDFDEKKKAEAGRIGRESMANGTAPTLRVVEIRQTGQPCTTQPRGGQ